MALFWKGLSSGQKLLAVASPTLPVLFSLWRNGTFQDLPSKLEMKYGVQSPIPCPNICYGHPNVDHKKARDLVRRAMDSDCHVHVLYAPRGTGKTRLLSEEANKRQKEGRRVFYFNSVSDMKYLRALMKIPSRIAPFSQIMPQKSVIVLDQMDMTYTGDLHSMLSMLATESTLSRSYSIVVCVSDIENAKTLLQKINDGGKVCQVGNGEDFKWEAAQVVSYVETAEVFKKWSEDDKKELISLGVISGKPSFLLDASRDKTIGKVPLRDNLKLKERAERDRKEWEEVKRRKFLKYEK